MDVELREALTQGFGPEPPHRSVADRVEAGHRAVRRRRLAGGLVAAAFAGVVGLGAVVVLGDGSTPSSEVASDPTTDTSAGGEPWVGGGLARYSDSGDLELRPGVSELERIDAPLGGEPGVHHSVALSLRYAGDVHWVMLEWKRSPDGETYTWSSSSFHPGGAFLTLRDWVEDQLALREDPEGYDKAEYLDLAPDGSIVTSGGVEVLEQRHPLDLKDFVEEPTDRTAAALLQGPDGKRWYVLVREVAHEVETIVVPYETGGPDLDAFLEYARDSYDSGEGVR